jgi:Spherulation-specific family 4
VTTRSIVSRNLSVLAVTILALLAAAPAASRASSSGVRADSAANASCISLVPPAYGPTVWTGISAPYKGPADVIADWGGTTNDHSSGGGPGGSFSKAHATTIMTARNNGVTVLGYVWTDYANSDPAYPAAAIREVEAQVHAWKAWYGVTDIFLDGATTGTGQGEITYYSRIYQYVQTLSPGASVWLNAGTYPSSPAYLSVANVIMDWENSSLPASPPRWVLRYPPSRFANIVNNYTGTVSVALAAIRADHAEYAFVTSSGGTYSTLPGYWPTEQADACP